VLVEPFDQCLNDFEKLENLIEKSIDLKSAQDNNEYKVNPKYS
jgi:hypothetical protein